MAGVPTALRAAAAQCVARARLHARRGRHADAAKLLHTLCLPPAELTLRAVSEGEGYVGAGTNWPTAHVLLGHAQAAGGGGGQGAKGTAGAAVAALASYARALVLEPGCFDAHAGAGVLLLLLLPAAPAGERKAAAAAQREQAVEHLRAATALPQGRTWFGGFLSLGDALGAGGAAQSEALAAYGKAAVSAQIAARREAAAAGGGTGAAVGAATTATCWHAAALCSAAALQLPGDAAKCGAALDLADGALGGRGSGGGGGGGGGKRAAAAEDPDSAAEREATEAAAKALLGARLSALGAALKGQGGAEAASLLSRAQALAAKAVQGSSKPKGNKKKGGGDGATLLIGQRQHLLPVAS